MDEFKPFLRPTKRNVVVAHSPSTNGILVNGVLTLKAEVNRGLARTHETLSDLSKKINDPQYWQPVAIDKILSQESEGTSLSDIVKESKQIRAHLPAIRVVVDLAAGLPDPGAITASEKHVSHMVHAVCNVFPVGWHATEALDTASVRIDFDHLKYLLHDTLMDVCMIHSWPNVLAKIRSMKPGEFNRLKFDYVKGQKSDCPYAKIVSDQPTYTSIASISRSAKLDRIRFDIDECKAFSFHWKEFLRQFVLENNGQPVPISPIGQIQRNARTLLGQLSWRKLEKAIEMSDPGRHILVVARHRPKKNQVHQKAVAHLLAGSAAADWTTNRFRLFPESHYHQIAWLSQYCDLFLVVISK